MKKMLKALLVILPLAAFGCRSSSSTEAHIIEPEIQLTQVQAPPDLRYGGSISVKFELQVENKSGEPLVLRKLDLRNVGTGAYVFRSRPIFFNARFPANRLSTIEFWADAYSRGGVLGADEPVMVRGIAYFEAPSGQVHKIFTQILPQFGNNGQ